MRTAAPYVRWNKIFDVEYHDQNERRHCDDGPIALSMCCLVLRQGEFTRPKAPLSGSIRQKVLALSSPTTGAQMFLSISLRLSARDCAASMMSED